MQPELSAFKWQHISLIENGDPHNPTPSIEMAMQLQHKGPSFTAWFNGKPIAAAGVAIHWRGTGEAWCYFSPEIWKHKIWLHRTIRRVLEDIIKAKHLRRVQAYISNLSLPDLMWPRFFGMTAEAVLQKYGPDGEDFIVFSRLT